VAAALAARGARVLSADDLAHQALRQPAVRDAVAARWGAGVLDEHGQVIRRRLAEIVFASPAERHALEALVHPWITRRLQEEVEAARSDPTIPLVVVDAAIMLETGWAGLCDRLVYVDAPRELRLARVGEQRRWTAQEAEAREAAQLPLTEKRLRADHVLDNSASLAHLNRQIDELMHLWGLDRTDGQAPSQAAASAPCRARNNPDDH
jgi:dephospho-CoA kinase